jgi:cobalt-zinc-cadmium efflux system protein
MEDHAHSHAHSHDQAGHGHAHDHAGHGHAGHSHAGHSHGAGATEGRLGIAFLIIFVFMFVEAIGGLFSGSLALLADAGHMVSDAAALGMSWFAMRVGKRPADRARSFGYKRLEVLAAFVNGCTLFVIAAGVVFEAVRRLTAPAPVLGRTMLVVAVAGLVANVAAFLVLSGGDRENLNLRSAWLHILGDVLGFVVAIVAAGIILWTHWSPIDPILSIVVVLLILRSAYEIVRSSSHILLEGTPPGIDLEEMVKDLKSQLPPESDIHHIHVWSLTAEDPLVTLHVNCSEQMDAKAIIATLNARLRERYGITHATIQVEPDGCNDTVH